MVRYFRNGREVNKHSARNILEDQMFERKRELFKELRRQYPNSPVDQDFYYLFDIMWMREMDAQKERGLI